ncbi:hypothetical protein T229_11070 [Tannerella sp. oral taxon BU063 isolate Cell 5]|uniref:Uncharacterized protein n=1 Tax=Tannerella sp. oral taxon BU063 isolate Cell 5 TaxID=1410950 RepID=W2CC42_9BACT|nr:hypothetical protein T229_11070 [Tannerella sp. oral taxon BU063 isolate Cell 5]
MVARIGWGNWILEPVGAHFFWGHFPDVAPDWRSVFVPLPRARTFLYKRYGGRRTLAQGLSQAHGCACSEGTKGTSKTLPGRLPILIFAPTFAPIIERGR